MSGKDKVQREIMAAESKKRGEEREFRNRRALQLTAEGLDSGVVASRLGLTRDGVNKLLREERRKREAAEALEQRAWMDELP